MTTRIDLNLEHVYRALRGNLLFDDETRFMKTRNEPNMGYSARIQPRRKFHGRLVDLSENIFTARMLL